jgi:hypothetical protein
MPEPLDGKTIAKISECQKLKKPRFPKKQPLQSPKNKLLYGLEIPNQEALPMSDNGISLLQVTSFFFSCRRFPTRAAHRIYPGKFKGPEAHITHKLIKSDRAPGKDQKSVLFLIRGC